jgi:phospholipid/cholesterol/gamma-HCH transport system substrate-binding protein
MLIGTTATIQASFTGVSTIMLDGARKDAPAITCETTACPDGVPLIPPSRGGFNEILASAPVLLERLATLTERLNEVLSDENQAEIKGILRNTNRMTDSLARSGPQLEGAMKELEVTLREAGETLDAFETVTKSTDRLLNQEGAALAQQLRETLASANAAAASLSKTLEDTRPIARQLSDSTLPNAEATLRDLRATSKALRNVTEKLENQGLGTLIEGQSLPDYEP